MGLDMYLNARRYISPWSEDDAPVRTRVAEACSLPVKNWKVDGVSYAVAYWRKANAIHQWFVVNVQDGVDQCQQTYVSHDQLVALYESVCTVLAEPEKAKDLLPTQEGFFFGSTDYDEGYIAHLEYTKEYLEPIVELIQRGGNALRGFYFYYHSSW